MIYSTGTWKRCTYFARPMSHRRCSSRSDRFLRQNFDRSTRLFDRRNSAFGCAMDGKLEGHLDFTLTEQAHAAFGAPQHPAPNQGLDVDCVLCVEHTPVDRRLNTIKVHHV